MRVAGLELLGDRASLRVPCLLRLKLAQEPYIIWSLGLKILKFESSAPYGQSYPQAP